MKSIIVGAGAAGLATGQALQKAGISSVIFEKSEKPGNSWRHRYDKLRLNTIRSMSSLPGYAMERSYGAWPYGTDFADYLIRYAGIRQTKKFVSDLIFSLEAPRERHPKRTA